MLQNETIKLVDLDPKFEIVKSYYGKAKLSVRQESTILISYNTPVLEKNHATGKVKLLNTSKYSNTTLRHIREFLFQEGYEKMSKKDILNTFSAE